MQIKDLQKAQPLCHISRLSVTELFVLAGIICFQPDDNE